MVAIIDNWVGPLHSHMHTYIRICYDFMSSDQDDGLSVWQPQMPKFAFEAR